MAIPKRYEGAEYAQVPQNIKEKFEKILETRKGMYIFGGVGTGKTHIVYALKKEWDSKSTHPAIFWNTTELLQEIKDDISRSAWDKKRPVEKIMDSRKLLFLDDIGNEAVTEFVQGTFYLLINHRYNEMLPTIFTSNLSIGQLAEKVGDRIASRIVEMCDVVPLTGNDRRIKK